MTNVFYRVYRYHDVAIHNIEHTLKFLENEQKSNHDSHKNTLMTNIPTVYPVRLTVMGCSSRLICTC